MDCVVEVVPSDMTHVAVYVSVKPELALPGVVTWNVVDAEEGDVTEHVPDVSGPLVNAIVQAYV